jgi:hypothetical protein
MSRGTLSQRRRHGASCEQGIIISVWGSVRAERKEGLKEGRGNEEGKGTYRSVLKYRLTRFHSGKCGCNATAFHRKFGLRNDR